MFHLLKSGCEIKYAMILAVMSATYAIGYVETKIWFYQTS